MEGNGYREPIVSASIPEVVFVDPQPGWARFPQSSTRTFLTLLHQTLKIGGRELMLIGVGGHHAAVLVVQDRTPLEIAQIGIQHYRGIKAFCEEGLFKDQPKPLITALGSTWVLSYEFTQSFQGEGFTIGIAPWTYTSS